MTAPTLTLTDLFAALRDATPEYPEHLRQPRREALLEQMREGQADSDGLWKQERDDAGA